MKNKTLALFFLNVFLVSCNLKTKRENDPADITEARRLCDKFIQFCAQGSYDSALIYTSDIDVNAIKDGDTQADSLLGKLISFEFQTGSSLIEKKEDGLEGSIALDYLFKRDKKNAVKTFFLEPKNNSFKIVGMKEKFDI